MRAPHTIAAAISLLAFAVPCVARGQAEELPPASTEPAPSPGLSPPAVPTPLATPPSSSARPATVSPASRLVLIPSLGLNVPVSTLARSYSSGFHAGALIGRRLAGRFSVNGEVALDFMNADNDSSVVTPHEYYVAALFSPLVHFRAGDVVVGPKLGWFVNRRTQSAESITPRECLSSTGTRSGCAYTDAPTVVPHTGQGFLIGANAAGFVPVGTVRLGLWASGTFGRFVTATCGGASCTSGLGNVVVLSLALAAFL